MNPGSRMNMPAQMQANPQMPDFGIEDDNDPFAVPQDPRSLSSIMMDAELIDKNATIFEEMEDLTPYLAGDDFGCSDANSSFLEPVLQKQRAIYSDINVQQSLVLDNPPNYTVLASCDNPMDVPRDLNDRSSYSPQMYYQPVKQENDDYEEDEEEDADSLAPTTSRATDSNETVDLSRSEPEFHAKPRKYNLKPDAVKKTTKYLDARKRNNLAVRKSRNKQKKLQAEKEGKLRTLEMAIKELDDELKEERRDHAALKEQYGVLQQNYKKTVEENKRLRNEIDRLRISRGGVGYRLK